MKYPHTIDFQKKIGEYRKVFNLAPVRGTNTKASTNRSLWAFIIVYVIERDQSQLFHYPLIPDDCHSMPVAGNAFFQKIGIPRNNAIHNGRQI